jgi:hypothetical protein
MQRRTALTAIAAFTSLTALPRAFAMYDPKPNGALVHAPGAWKGSLTYRDWTNPEKMVKLPCTMTAALTKPDELALYYVFDDGPGKIVYSYERMSFDFEAKRLVWVSGTAKPTTSQLTLSSVQTEGETTRMLFERAVDARTDKYVFELGKRSWSLSKAEVSAAGAETFRNKYEFTRSEG